jgi:hypothetical protein
VRLGRFLLAAATLPAVFYLVTLAQMEIHLRDPEVAKSPDGRFYAERLPDGSVRIDRLPCGNVLAPPPVFEVAEGVKGLSWSDGRTLQVKVKPGSHVAQHRPGPQEVRLVFVGTP